MKITRFSRLISVVSAITLLFSSSFAGIYSMSESVGSAIGQWARGKPGHFTDKPIRPFLGLKPGRSKDRGGMWSKKALQAAAMSKEAESGLEASTEESASGMHTLIIAAEPGSSLPWEGGFGDGVNSGNGNKLTSLNLFSWRTRGGMAVDFTLYHNSQTNYNDELGYGWTWTYDVYINETLGVATVHWGDGTCIPFTLGLSGYTAPTGIFDGLVKNMDGTWTLTKKDQTVLSFNDDGFLTEIEDKNGNAITITLNGSNYATRVTDSTGRYY